MPVQRADALGIGQRLAEGLRVAVVVPRVHQVRGVVPQPRAYVGRQMGVV